MLFRSSRRLNAMILVFPFCSCSYESDASSCLSIFVRICRSWRTAICIVTDESLLARVHASGSCATLRRKWNSRRLRECFSRPSPLCAASYYVLLLGQQFQRVRAIFFFIYFLLLFIQTFCIFVIFLIYLIIYLNDRNGCFTSIRLINVNASTS